MPKTLVGHQATGILTALLAEGSASGTHHDHQAEILPTCTLKREVSELCSETSMAEVAPPCNRIANTPAQPLPASLFSRESDHSFQRIVAKHGSSTEVSTPAQMHAMASCQSAPASLLPHREPFMSDQQLCHQQQHTSVGAKQRRIVMHSLPCHHTAPPAFTSGSHHAPGSIRRSTAGTHSLHTAWSAPLGKGLASKLQANAQCFVTSPSAEGQAFDHQVPQTPQLWHSVQAQPASGDASQSDDSVAISPQHRQAWDASLGSLQSFKKLCRQVQSSQQQSWSIASASDHSSKLPSIMQKDTAKPYLSIPEYAWPDVRQLHKACSVPEAQQPFRCSSSRLPLPANQPLPRASPASLQSAQHSSLAILQQHLPPPFQLVSSAPYIPQQISPAVTACLPSQAPKAAAVIHFGQAQRLQCATIGSGSLPMSAAEVEALHTSQLEELQHSTLDWMAANFGATSRYK